MTYLHLALAAALVGAALFLARAFLAGSWDLDDEPLITQKRDAWK